MCVKGGCLRVGLPPFVLYDVSSRRNQKLKTKTCRVLLTHAMRAENLPFFSPRIPCAPEYATKHIRGRDAYKGERDPLLLRPCVSPTLVLRHAKASVDLVSRDGINKVRDLVVRVGVLLIRRTDGVNLSLLIPTAEVPQAEAFLEKFAGTLVLGFLMDL